ncbi:MAG: hypothetical protein ABS949_14465 [Solibacillus sp.]
MKILYITLAPINSNSSATLRNKALIKGFVENGNEVDVISIVTPNSNPYFNGDNKKFIFGNHIILNKNSINEKNKKQQTSKNAILRKIASKIFHTFSIHDGSIIHTKKVNSYINNNLQPFYDIIISSSDPKTGHILARNIINNGIKYGKWIQYWGDPLTLDIATNTFYPKRILGIKERNLISNADQIVYVSPFTLEKQCKLFDSLKEKMFFLPIPYLEEKIYEKPCLKNKIVISYFGDYLSEIRNIVPLFNTIKSLNSNFSLNIIGNSDLKLKDTANITILNRIPLEELEKKEQETDVIVCILNCKGTQIPGKLYYYAATNKPILVIIDGENQKELKEYLDGYDRFILCENQESSIRQALEQLEFERKLYYPAKQLEASVIAKKFLELN